MSCRVKVPQDFAPCTVFCRAASVAFVDHNEIEEVWRELFVDVLDVLVARHRLIQRQVDLIRLVDVSLLVHSEFDGFFCSVRKFDGFAFGAQLGHRAFEWSKVIDHRLIDQDVAISKEQDSFFRTGFPKSPDDLECGKGLAGAGGHDQQGSLLSLTDGVDYTIDCDGLVVSRATSTAVRVVRLCHDRDVGRSDLLCVTVLLPELLWRWELIQRQFPFNGSVRRQSIVKQKAVAVGAEDKWDVQRLRIVQRLLHPASDAMVVVLRFDDGQGHVGAKRQQEVGKFRMPRLTILPRTITGRR